ncbi:PAAR domain-containing protein [Burkholderia contaminans]|uniref:PAAR domain-containing protein n=2 Tax=Burkholderia cepacia complex TaxID=87882 RepID=UPI001FC83602|nr:PAAR domain-containing protein [Burkholderia contaminans]
MATMFNGALAFGAFFLPGFMWRFSLVPCSGGWSWKPDSLGFHWRTAAFNLQLRLGHCLIEEGDPSMTDNGVPIARHGHRATCGCHLISSLI